MPALDGDYEGGCAGIEEAGMCADVRKRREVR